MKWEASILIGLGVALGLHQTAMITPRPGMKCWLGLGRPRLSLKRQLKVVRVHLNSKISLGIKVVLIQMSLGVRVLLIVYIARVHLNTKKNMTRGLLIPRVLVYIVQPPNKKDLREIWLIVYIWMLLKPKRGGGDLKIMKRITP